jgi:hypothetical protein
MEYPNSTYWRMVASLAWPLLGRLLYAILDIMAVTAQHDLGAGAECVNDCSTAAGPGAIARI